MQDTYTAHAMTLDVFNKIAEPGKKIVLPYSDLWPNGYVRAFKIPKKIDTFLFSPFNESYHPHYMFNGFRCTIGPHEDAIPLKNLGTPIERPTLEQFSVDLYKMQQKVNSIWNPKKRILILYDHTKAEKEDQNRMAQYNDVSIKILPFWPIVQVKDLFQSKPMWCHYSEDAIKSTYNEIIKIEELEKS
jgi:hypothetical protein